MSNRWAHRVVLSCVIFNLIAALAAILRGGPWWVIVAELLATAVALLMLWSLKRLDRDIAEMKLMMEALDALLPPP